MADRVPLLSVEGLCVDFEGTRGIARVLSGVSLSVAAGETLGIVGESGSGKSMTALAILRLVPDPPGRISRGRIVFAGEDLAGVSPQRMREIRGNKISMIFQEPMTSLNPVFTVGAQICETLALHLGLRGEAARRRAVELLKDVRIPAAEERFGEYPHQLSGGMRQRVMIAMAMACEPALLIADEPTTALDVTVQAQIFDLLRDIQRSRGMGLILITHDMGAIAEMADRVAVMYGGRVVEEGATRDVLERPQHPYTRGLVACVPDLDAEFPERRALTEIPGLVPSIWELQEGCPFADRCAETMLSCRTAMPPDARVADRRVACWQRPERVA
ncbi:MAG: ABC transporter ATP-binding protein [Hyphomicrobiaceae bacterium]|nr:ABC transporter ATP-binding protein [Hyphomicrobiaceae bacterium]